MDYIYGTFTDKQIINTEKRMHSDLHKLLLYKDKGITDKLFDTEDDYFRFFSNTLFRFGGLNRLLGEPKAMVFLMSTLQAAFDEVCSPDFRYGVFRKAILDCHGYVKSIFDTREVM